MTFYLSRFTHFIIVASQWTGVIARGKIFSTNFFASWTWTKMATVRLQKIKKLNDHFVAVFKILLTIVLKEI